MYNNIATIALSFLIFYILSYISQKYNKEGYITVARNMCTD